MAVAGFGSQLPLTSGVAGGPPDVALPLLDGKCSVVGRLSDEGPAVLR